jgi:hypothetical protein
LDRHAHPVTAFPVISFSASCSQLSDHGPGTRAVALARAVAGVRCRLAVLSARRGSLSSSLRCPSTTSRQQPNPTACRASPHWSWDRWPVGPRLRRTLTSKWFTLMMK